MTLVLIPAGEFLMGSPDWTGMLLRTKSLSIGSRSASHSSLAPTR